MREPDALTEARRSLSRAEADPWASDCVAELDRALDLIDEVVAGPAAAQRGVARNLIGAYRARFERWIEERLAAEPAPTEPELEHLFKVLLAFDRAPDGPSDGAAAVKIEIARRLVERYYEGHPAESKRRALDELAAVAARSAPAPSPPGRRRSRS